MLHIVTNDAELPVPVGVIPFAFIINSTRLTDGSKVRFVKVSLFGP